MCSDACILNFFQGNGCNFSVSELSGGEKESVDFEAVLCYNKFRDETVRQKNNRYDRKGITIWELIFQTFISKKAGFPKKT